MADDIVLFKYSYGALIDVYADDGQFIKHEVMRGNLEAHNKVSAKVKIHIEIEQRLKNEGGNKKMHSWELD